MNRSVLCLALLVAMFTVAGQAHGLIIHESATLGSTGQTAGTNISSVQFLGSRFHIDTTTKVTHIGGHMGITGGDLFGVIVSLSDPTLSNPNPLPSGSPFDSSEIVASTTFNPGSPSSDFLTPLSVTLSVGYYALIFGSGQFGTMGQGFMTTNNTDISGQASYFHWNSSGWIDGGFVNTRFVVTGNPIPEPTTLCLMGFGLLGVLVVVIRRRRAKS
jgi:hypothetical protein